MKVSKLFNFVENVIISSSPKPWKLQKPKVMQFPVNDVCNARCQMCNIWQQKYDYQISPLELEIALSNPLFTEIQSVGVNGGEPTLRKDLAELVNVLFSKLPKLSTIALITNSLNSDQVIERICEVGEVVRAYRGNLDVMVSLDGINAVHDQVRGRKGNFENAVRVIDFLKTTQLVTSRRLGCTVIKENVFGIEDLLEFAIEKNIYIKYRLGIPHQRLYSKDVEKPFELTFDEKYHLAIFLENLSQFYEKSEYQKYFYKSLIAQLIYKRPRSVGCDWQHRGVTLSARGELMYCAVESKVLGSAISENSEELYFYGREHLNEILETKCDTCVHDYVGLPQANILLKNLIKGRLKKVESLRKSKSVQALLKSYRNVTFTRKMHSHGLLPMNANGNLSLSSSYRWNADPSVSKKVLICGWYGTETLGDKAILGGVVGALKDSLGNIEIHLASLEPYISHMTALQLPELDGCQIHAILDSIQIAKSMDLVVFGGGPLMPLNELLDMCSIFREAVDSRIPTLIAGCGVGPLGSESHNQAIRYLLMNASYRIYRDLKSKELSKSLGVNTVDDGVAEDPAFTWLTKHMCYSIPSKDVKLELSLPKVKTLLLGLRDWPYNQYAPNLSSNEGEYLKSKFESSLIGALQKLVDTFENIRIVPFPMCTNHIGGDDRWFYRRLFRDNVRLASAIDFTYLGKEVAPLEAVELFKSSSAALTMRFHSLVFALSARLPVVSIDYTLGQGKVHSLADKYNVQNLSLDAVDVDMLYYSLCNLLEESSVLPDGTLNREFNTEFPHLVSQFIRRLNRLNVSDIKESGND